MNSWTGRGAAIGIYAPDFDEESARLPTKVRNQIEQKLNEMGMRLSEFPHHRLTGSSDCRLRAFFDVC